MTTLDPGQGTTIINALSSLATLFKEISDNVLGTPEENNVAKTQETVEISKTTTVAKIVATTPPAPKNKDIIKIAVKKEIKRSTNNSGSNKVVVVEMSEDFKKNSDPKKTFVNLIKPAENGLQIKSMKESNGKIVIVTNTPEQAEKILKLNKSLKQTG